MTRDPVVLLLIAALGWVAGYLTKFILDRLNLKDKVTVDLINEWHSETMNKHRTAVWHCFDGDKAKDKRVRQRSYYEIRQELRDKNCEESKNLLLSLSMVLHYIERVSDYYNNNFIDRALWSISLRGFCKYYVKEYLALYEPVKGAEDLAPVMRKLRAINRFLY